MNGEYSCSTGARASLFCGGQAVSCLCASAGGGAYLALHPAGSLPVRSAVTMGVRCCSVNEEAPGVRQSAGQLSPIPAYCEEKTTSVYDEEICSVLFVLFSSSRRFESTMSLSYRIGLGPLYNYFFLSGGREVHQHE